MHRLPSARLGILQNAFRPDSPTNEVLPSDKLTNRMRILALVKL